MIRVKHLAMVVALAAATAAHAQVVTGPQGNGTNGLSAATGTAAANGGAVSIDSHSVTNAEGTRYAAGTAIAPGLTSSNDTCMGSTSAGVQGMSVGVSIGSTWEDHNCRMLKNSREMWNMGMRGAAIKLLCQDDDNRFALESTGVDCGETKDDWKKNGQKVAVIQRPAPQVAQLPPPVVVTTTSEAQRVEQNAADIIRQDQARKAQQVASTNK